MVIPTTWPPEPGFVGALPDPPQPNNSTLAAIWQKALIVHRLCADISCGYGRSASLIRRNELIA
jgi:hypothetical protein